MWEKTWSFCRSFAMCMPGGGVHDLGAHILSSIISSAVQLDASTCGVLCLLYFQNFAEFTRSASLCSRASLSLWRSRERSLFTPSRELVSMRTYLASLSSSVTLLEKRRKWQCLSNNADWIHLHYAYTMRGKKTTMSLTYCGSLSVSAVSFNKMSWSTCKIISTSI